MTPAQMEASQKLLAIRKSVRTLLELKRDMTLSPTIGGTGLEHLQLLFVDFSICKPLLTQELVRVEKELRELGVEF